MGIIRNLYISLAAGCMAFGAAAEAPAGYYDACEGKTGQALLAALYQTITDHTVVSYSGLWTLYATTDLDENGKIWDMYSTKRWTYKSDQCGSAQYIGDCYNREHSMPKSWFNDASPMVSDAFHIYPTDGRVNNQRSNYPFGECANGSYVASRGGVDPLGRLGASTFSGYSGTVFEPDDMYKGDFARTYFYMATCYNNRISSWKSDMLDGTSYPAFTDWAKRLLLKWSRQDEVSAKETSRNDAVYAAQANRNPYIDHPELAEYIWGDKVGQPWYSANASTADFITPAADETISLGHAAVGIARTRQIAVKGRGLTDAVSVAVSGPGYSVSPTSITAAACNAGTTVTVSLTATGPGDAEGTLRLQSGDILRTVELAAVVEEGLPLNEATEITSESFAATWIWLGDAATYSLTVSQNGQTLPGYPVSVDAAAERYVVGGLEPAADYTFSLSSGSLSSAVRSVRTADPIPSIDVIYDGLLAFTSNIGEPSDIAELVLETQYITSDIAVSVQQPFEVSTDKTNWATATTLLADEDRFYLRLNGQQAGTFTSSVTLTAGDYVNDDVEATGTVIDPSIATSFFEDWEAMDESEKPTTYSTTSFRGTAAQWSVDKGGFGTGTQDKAFNGTSVLRMNKTSASLTLDEDKAGGIGTVSFDAARWPNKGDAAISLAIEYSDDRGAVWTEVGNVTIESTDATGFSVPVNRPGNGRIRFRATAGGRWFIDNIRLTDCKSTSLEGIDYYSWDAYCLDGRLVIEVRETATQLTVYGMDGITYSRGPVAEGRTYLALPKGLYVVASPTHARRVLVK